MSTNKAPYDDPPPAYPSTPAPTYQSHLNANSPAPARPYYSTPASNYSSSNLGGGGGAAAEYYGHQPQPQPPQYHQQQPYSGGYHTGPTGTHPYNQQYQYPAQSGPQQMMYSRAPGHFGSRRTGRGSDGLIAVLLGTLACCCCLDCVF